MKTTIKRPSLLNYEKYVGLLVGLFSTLSLLSCDTQKQEEASQLSEEALIQRGKYLTTIGGCHDCHSPKIMTPEGPMPDPDRLLSGHPQGDQLGTIINTQDWIMFSQGLTAYVGPWGVSYAANLTPDETGIGKWSFQHFETAIRNGKSKGIKENRELLPPMPWQMYKGMSDEDLHAIFSYLKSLKPIHNLVPQPISPEDAKKM